MKIVYTNNPMKESPEALQVNVCIGCDVPQFRKLPLLDGEPYCFECRVRILRQEFRDVGWNPDTLVAV